MRKNSVYFIRRFFVSGLVAAVALAFSFPSWAAAPKSTVHDFAEAKVIDRIILSVIEDYYDPKRIDSGKMFEAVMETLQKGIAELKVDYDEKKEIARIEVLREAVNLPISDIKSPWALSNRLHTAFKFIAKHLPESEYDFMDLEYAAANALLATLDPHSNALPPDLFKILQMDTAGEFGGLGIKITTDRRAPCNGRLTVVEVFDNTPAADAGIRVGDTIVRIDNESTVNITTSEAADRLRGVPGTKVKVQIKRPNAPLLDYTITRRMVPIASVKWEMLKDKVGYIKLEAFQENSAQEIGEALEQLHEQKMKGLILDLRSNPGGLLHAAIAAANLFLSSGTIVATAGRPQEDRVVENAEAEGTEPMYPMVVLIDSYSASAAEIMAGALRNHGRALLIGETTFGKGSVQMIDQIPDGGAVKLTSAQYLTPGDISIQAVGVPPDLTFTPVVPDKDEIRMLSMAGRFSEADLEAHLDRPNIRTRTDRSPVVTAPLLVPPAEAQAERDRFKRCFFDDEIKGSYKDRHEKEAARRLIAAADRAGADALLLQAEKMIKEDGVLQEEAMEAAFRKLRVDWSPSPDEQPEKTTEKAAAPSMKVTWKILDKIIPGKSFKVKVTVENQTDKPVYRLHAFTKSDNPLLGDHEFVFGKVSPKERRSWTKSILLPVTADPRVDDMTINFDAQAGPIPEPSSIEVEIPSRAAPNLIFGWQFQDKGNENGVFEPGEEIALFVTVKNIGKGPTLDAEVELAAKPGIDIKKGLLDIGSLAPGASTAGELHLSVIKQFPLNEAELTLAVREWTETRLGIPTTRSLKERTIKLPISTVPNSPTTVNEILTVTQSVARLLESPAEDSSEAASAPKDAVFQADKKYRDFYRVLLTDRRSAWIAAADVQKGGKKPAPVFEPYMEAPPKIDIKNKTVQRLLGDEVVIKGSATHPVSIRDVIIFVGDKKVFYQPAENKSQNTRLDFSARVPLEEGPNHIMVVARHNDKTMDMQTLFVRRDANK